MNIDNKNSLIFSVNYENYQKNILTDKENRTLGEWSISKDMTNELKYAYAYLTNSEQMIVKKYEVEHFELAKEEKGYIGNERYAFVFKKSEDAFFVYPFSTVQGRHYRNDEEMDALPRLDKGEVDRRLELSRVGKTLSEPNRKDARGRTGVTQQAQVRLRDLFKEEYSHRQMPHFEVSKKMIATVEADPEQDLNALLDEYYLAEDNKQKK